MSTHTDMVTKFVHATAMTGAPDVHDLANIEVAIDTVTDDLALTDDQAELASAVRLGLDKRAPVDRVKDSLRMRGHDHLVFRGRVGGSLSRRIECACLGVFSVLAHSDEAMKGDDVKVLVVRGPGSSVSEEELIEFLSGRTPRFMIPRYVELVDEQLPKTPTSKVREFELRQADNAGAWDREVASVASNGIAAKS